MAIADQENNSTVGRAAVSDQVVEAAASNANLEGRRRSANNTNTRQNQQRKIFAINEGIRPAIRREAPVEELAYDDNNMEYAWLEPRHDPIATDTNLAEIDFEDFRNEDLAYAFSCGVS